MRVRPVVLLALLVWVVVAVWVLAACMATPQGAPAASTTTWRPEVPEPKAPLRTPDRSVARSLLGTVGRSNAAGPGGFTQGKFGYGWADDNHDGCDTRMDVVAHWLRTPVLAGMCDSSGTVPDPYSGQALLMPQQAHLDHVVSLADAWASGAAEWTAQQRSDFYNDQADLVPTSAEMLMAKDGRGPDQWLPPDRAYWCTYASAYLGVKSAYHLTVTDAQVATLRAALDTCVDAPPSAVGPATHS